MNWDLSVSWIRTTNTNPEIKKRKKEKGKKRENELDIKRLN